MAQQDTAARAAAPAQGQQAGTGIAARGADRVPGSYAAPDDVTKRLQWAAGAGGMHVVGGVAVCPSMPDGCEVALSIVQVDVDAETYGLGEGKLGLAKSALQRIGLSSGVRWNVFRTNRTDDGSNPHYCAWRAEGEVTGLDGTTSPVIGSVELDLRDGSAQVLALNERAKRKGRKDAADQVREMRMFITRHAETKAMLRAIRSLGIRTSYTREELQRPFVCAKLMFTGKSEDPELRKHFATMRAERMLGGTAALYGQQQAPALLAGPTHAAPANVPALPRHNAPPPVSSTSAADAFDDGEIVEADEAPAPPKVDTRLFMPGKKGAPKVMVKDAEDKDLAFWIDRLTKGLAADPEKDYADKDRDLVASIGFEMTRRLAAEAKPAPKGDAKKPTGSPLADAPEDERTPFDDELLT